MNRKECNQTSVLDSNASLNLSNVVVELVDSKGFTRAKAVSLSDEHCLTVKVFDPKDFIAQVERVAIPFDTKIVFYNPDGSERHSYIYHSWSLHHGSNPTNPRS